MAEGAAGAPAALSVEAEAMRVDTEIVAGLVAARAAETPPLVPAGHQSTAPARCSTAEFPDGNKPLAIASSRASSVWGWTSPLV